MSGFDTRRAAELAQQPEEQRWLVEHVWSAQGVGVIGGEPKCCKSFLALELAVAVASGAPCLRRFAVAHHGPVLLFAAEDALHTVRERLSGIAAIAGVDFERLDVHVITAPTLRLDLDQHRRRLRATVERVRPKLVVLDPFVRLHRCDENAAAEVAPLLAYLRELQRSFETAVLLVHHARKAGHARAGQALRGSSEIHAWGDSNLYLQRQRDQLRLSVEHRASASIPSLWLELRANTNGAVALRILDESAAPEAAPPISSTERVQLALEQASEPLSMRALRVACRMRTATVSQAVHELERKGLVVDHDGRFQLA
jgi:hypothetical protein